MFQRFTDRARRVVVSAQEEARQLNHGHIGTEHLLLGLFAAGGVAGEALADLGMSRDAVRAGVQEVVGHGDSAPRGHIPFTDPAKQTLEAALREAISLGHDHIGSEHILLGLVATEDSVATQLLERLEVDPASVRQALTERLASTPAGASEDTEAQPCPTIHRPAPQRRGSGLIALLFVVTAILAVEIESPGPDAARWGLSLVLGGVLLWGGGVAIGSGRHAGPRSSGMAWWLGVMGTLTLAAAAVVFVLGALL